MMDEKFDDFLSRAVKELDPAPVAPREEMWARIKQERAQARVTSLESRRNRKVWISAGVGAAAMLVIGIGLGRLTFKDPHTTGAVAVAPVNNASATAYRVAVSDYMTKAEVLLTEFRTQPKGSTDPQVAELARDLLTNTRLLLDSPAAKDPKVAALLSDLELIIAQIAQAQNPSTVERDIIKDGMNKTAVLPRVRASQITSAGT